jgi:hypothetical protein
MIGSGETSVTSWQDPVLADPGAVVALMTTSFILEVMVNAVMINTATMWHGHRRPSVAGPAGCP